MYECVWNFAHYQLYNMISTAQLISTQKNNLRNLHKPSWRTRNKSLRSRSGESPHWGHFDYWCKTLRSLTFKTDILGEALMDLKESLCAMIRQLNSISFHKLSAFTWLMSAISNQAPAQPGGPGVHCLGRGTEVTLSLAAGGWLPSQHLASRNPLLSPALSKHLKLT